MSGKKIYPYVCKVCGKNFFIDKYTLNKLERGEYKNTYCSRECSNKAKHTGYDVQCCNCGKIFYRRLQHIQRSDNQFCSTECANEYVRKQHNEIRNCEICGKEFEVLKSSSQRFCSIQCQGKWQSTQIGEINPRFQRKQIECAYCGNFYWIKQYKLQEDSVHCCSAQCRQNWFREVYSKQPDVIDKCRKRGTQLLSEGKTISKTNSKPQRIADAILDDLNIKYEREKSVVYYCVDDYLVKFDLFIEVQGDYWHCNPIKYSTSISKLQAENIRHDKAKHTYIKNQYNKEVLYLWESDLYKDKEKCKKLIDLYVKNNGILKNYHSFNYSVINNELLLNNTIVYSYQDIPFSEYKNLIITDNP